MDEPKIRWKNFRGYADSDLIALRPLTLVIGANNVGKTALVAPLILLKQTLSSPDSETPLLLQGPMLNVGTYEDIVRGHQISRDISFQLDLSPATRPRALPVGQLPPVSLEFRFSGREGLVRPSLESYELRDALGRRMLRRTRRENSGSYSIAGFGPTVDHFTRRLKSRKEPWDRRFRTAVARARPDHFLFGVEPVLEAFFASTGELYRGQRIRTGDLKEIRSGPFAYLNVVGYADRLARELIDPISYLGPIRQRIRRYYEIGGEIPEGVGKEGEGAPEVLFRRSDRSSLSEVNRLLRTFGFRGALACQAVSQDLFSIVMRRGRGSSALAVNAADMGFGLSQILPLVVECVFSRTGSTLVSAQPEIHLNPRLQAVVGDLLVGSVNEGKRFVVETHSEHLILRVRRLIAEGRLGADKVSLVYVEQDESGLSSARCIDIDEDGHISSDEWPEGFFGDSLRDAFALAAAQRGRRHRRLVRD